MPANVHAYIPAWEYMHADLLHACLHADLLHTCLRACLLYACLLHACMPTYNIDAYCILACLRVSACLPVVCMPPAWLHACFPGSVCLPVGTFLHALRMCVLHGSTSIPARCMPFAQTCHFLYLNLSLLIIISALRFFGFSSNDFWLYAFLRLCFTPNVISVTDDI
jgi:hypothetical protein